MRRFQRRAPAHGKARRNTLHNGIFAGTVSYTHLDVYKRQIQANMNKAHRDRIAFIRICSGKFAKGMEVEPVSYTHLDVYKRQA